MSAPARGIALDRLLQGLAAVPANGVRVEDLTLDSRAVRAGSLFVALAGRARHGLEFAADAAARGASVMLWEPDEGAAPADSGRTAPADAASSTPMFTARVANLRGILGRIADRFFGEPSAQLRIVGITGTNGKTTSAYLLAQCLQHLGGACAYQGTLGWGRIGALAAPTHTTPDVITVHRQLAALRDSGVRDVAMEVSSHALDQGRVDGVRFHAAAFTNLTRDHLDYHADMAAYAAAKARLFAMPDLEHLIVNVGDACGRDLAARHAGPVPLIAVWVGAEPAAVRAQETLSVSQVNVDAGRGAGIGLELAGSSGAAHLATQLLGRFNAENCVVVVGCLLALGVELAAAARALEGCGAAPGRMEVVAGAGRTPLTVIDYAHTPDALAKALAALREHCRGLLWCVFGCGGDRDAGKRPLMGAAVDRLADRIIVTDDNPRSEDPQLIVQGILAGITAHQPRVIHDRGRAIATALEEAGAEDAVLIAGKGHEEYQIYGATRRGFSDRREALRCLGAAA